MADVINESKRAAGLTMPPAEGTQHLLAPLAKAIAADPDASEALDAMLTVIREHQALDPLPVGESARLVGMANVDLHPGTNIKSAPYDGGGANGPAQSHYNPETGKFGLTGNAGAIQGGQGDHVYSVCWLTCAVTAPQSRTVDARAVVKWEALWKLAHVGVAEALVGAGPRATARAGVNLQAYDSNGPVTDLVSHTLVNQDYAGTSTSWREKQNDDGGYAPQMQVSFQLPAGQTRWVNAIFWLDLNAYYSPIWNQASSSLRINGEVVFFAFDGL
ncbi:hypothetical protein [Acrocarpospora phusangensis]|nr:hypothetical protein [Acrocarpospora phusangensis]